MEPFNYDLFAPENISAFIAGIGILLFSIGVGCIGFVTLGRKEFLSWLLLLVSLAAGGLIAWGVGKDIVEAKNNEARLDQFIAQVNDIYGIELDTETAAALNPPFSTPTAEYEEFGRTSIPFMDSTIPAVLVWNEGVLFLGVDGSNNSLPTLEDLAEQDIEVPAEETPGE